MNSCQMGPGCVDGCIYLTGEQLSINAHEEEVSTSLHM